MRNLYRRTGFIVVTILAVLALNGRLWSQGAAVSAIKTDSVIAGEKGDFMEVRHLVLRGSHESKETHKLVDTTQTPPTGSHWAPTRTLWHALYSPERRSMQLSFYLRDEPDTSKPGAIKIVRSPYREFKLKGVAQP